MPGGPIAIVADSTTSLPTTLVDGLPLYIVPFEIHHGQDVYYDGRDITPGDFYALQAQGEPLPTTSSPRAGAFLEAYREAAAHADTIVCLTLSSELSAAYQTALVAQEAAKQEMPNASVSVVDSRMAGTAEGLIALEAARAAANGASLDDVMEVVRRRIEDAWFVGYFDTLYYLWRGGRLPRAGWWIGNLLNFKPVLELSAGRIGAIERPRSKARATERVAALVGERLEGRDARIAVAHSNAPADTAAMAERLERDLSPAELFVTDFTPVIGAHTGPGLVGCALHPLDTP